MFHWKSAESKLILPTFFEFQMRGAGGGGVYVIFHTYKGLIYEMGG